MMTLHNYWWLLIWPFLFGALSLFVNMRQEELIDGHLSVRWRLLPAILLVVPLVLWAGGRSGFGDTEQYRATFKSLPSNLNQIIPYLRSVKKGPGFRLIELLFKCLVSQSDISFFTFLAAIQIICLVYVYRRYSPNYWLSFFFFIASTDYLSWVQNGVRQFLAASILFLCVPLIAKKRFIPAIIIVLLVSLIHSSALIYLPFIFIINGRSWNMRTLFFIVGIIGAVIFVDQVTGILEEAMVDTTYEGDITYLKNNDGTHIFRVLFYSVPAIMCWVFRPYLDHVNDPLLNVCANLSIITAGFYVFSFFTSGILMGSIPIYFSLSNYILIPWLLREVFDRDSTVFIEAIFVLVYSAFFYYQCGPTWHLL